MEIGTVCEKTDGKEAGKICAVVDVVDDNFVLIDGNVKRRKCNLAHLKPSEKILKIKKGESTEKVKEAMQKEGIEVAEKIKLKERLRVRRETEKENRKEDGRKHSKKSH